MCLSTSSMLACGHLHFISFQIIENNQLWSKFLWINSLVSCSSSASLHKISIREPVDNHFELKVHLETNLSSFHMRLLLEGS